MPARRFSVNLSTAVDRSLTFLMQHHDCNQQDAVARAISIAATIAELQAEEDKELMIRDKMTGNTDRLIII